MNSTVDHKHRVLIADDHDLIVDMVESILLADNDFETARAGSFETVMSEIEKNGHFDVILLDLDMPGMNGIGGFERVIEANKDGAVVLFSGNARQEAVFRALDIGARGYVPKTLPAKSLKNALKFVLSGEKFLPSSLMTEMNRVKKSSKESLLSAKEMNVLRGICRGDTNKDIARALEVSEITVKIHVRSICTKLSVTNRTQVAVTAIARGLY